MGMRDCIVSGLTASVIALGAALAFAQPASAEDASARQTPAALEAAARRYFPSDEQNVPPARLFRLTRDQIFKVHLRFPSDVSPDNDAHPDAFHASNMLNHMRP